MNYLLLALLAGLVCQTLAAPKNHRGNKGQSRRRFRDEDDDGHRSRHAELDDDDEVITTRKPVVTTTPRPTTTQSDPDQEPERVVLDSFYNPDADIQGYGDKGMPVQLPAIMVPIHLVAEASFLTDQKAGSPKPHEQKNIVHLDENDPEMHVVHKRQACDPAVQLCSDESLWE